MFQFIDFERELRADNPTYERILRSDLHAVVNLVRHGSGSFTVQNLAFEMKRVPAIKWQKYRRTKEYLIRECPGLSEELRPRLINFRTHSLTRGGGNIIHVLNWQSDTGNLADLNNIRVREAIRWQAPNANVLPYVMEEYRVQGNHFGMGNAVFTPGNIGQGNDTHSASGPFLPAVSTFNDPGELEFVMTQTYQQSNNDGNSWTDIPNSTYLIRRVARRVGTQIQFTIHKTNQNNQSDTLSNTVLVQL